MDFDAVLGSARQVSAIAFTVPTGYSAHKPAADAVIADATLLAVPRGAKSAESFSGQVTVADRHSLIGDSTSLCPAGHHWQVWYFAVKHAGLSLKIPIAIDHRLASSFTLTFCFAAVDALGLKVSQVEFYLYGIFANPKKRGTYYFTATVTPLGATGSPDSSARFEMFADEPLPQSLTADATYDTATGTLIVVGKATIAGAAYSGIPVTIYDQPFYMNPYIPPAPPGATAKPLWSVLTTTNGSYRLERKVAPPPYVAAQIGLLIDDHCNRHTDVQGHCASETIDGPTSNAVRLTTTPPPPASLCEAAFAPITPVMLSAEMSTEQGSPGSLPWFRNATPGYNSGSTNRYQVGSYTISDSELVAPKRAYSITIEVFRDATGAARAFTADKYPATLHAAGAAPRLACSRLLAGAIPAGANGYNGYPATVIAAAYSGDVIVEGETDSTRSLTPQDARRAITLLHLGLEYVRSLGGP